MKRYEGITLIALVITVIIMLILVGVALSAISGDAGLFSRVQKTAELYNNQVEDEADTVNKIIDMLDEEYIKSINTGANEPVLVEGMKPVIFNDDGTTREPKTNAEWYNYEEKKWANAETGDGEDEEDGSLWVWIPRFAYKITYYTDDTKKTVKGTRDNDGYKKADGKIVTNTGQEAETAVDTIGTEVKSSYGSIDVVFLHDASNQYYTEKDGKIISRDAEDDGYIIHPAFKNGNGNYSNGEFKKELTGFWMAKFQAGWQYGDNSKDENQKYKDVVQKTLNEIKRSSVKYTQNQAWVPSVESGDSKDGLKTARNYLDGEYGENYAETKISYPVFKGNNYAMNYITVGESYSLAKALNETDNPYKFSTKDSDTHLTKNSEWGAVAYLGYSQYGLEGENIHINNKNLNNSVQSVYAVTGLANSSADAKVDEGTIELWHTETGQKGSTTGNITGETRKRASRNNYKQNDEKYGDAIYETSVTGEYLSTTGFNTDKSNFCYLHLPFLVRGGSWYDDVNAGLFSFTVPNGSSYYDVGFRAVVCPV